MPQLMPDSNKDEEAEADVSASFHEDGFHDDFSTGDAPENTFHRAAPPHYSVTLWPNRSLSPKGLRIVIALVGFGLLIPLVPFIGTPIAWGLIPFMAGALFAVYAAFMRSYRDGRLHEVLRLWPDLITVERIDPKGATKRWHANPFWVELSLHPDAKLENYITLKGNGRTIELGAFLSPEERATLHGELQTALRSAAD